VRATTDTHRFIGGRMRRRDICNQRGPGCLKDIDPNGPRNCSVCRARIALHHSDRPAYHATKVPRAAVAAVKDQTFRVTWVPHSANQKLGEIACTISTPTTCPPSCGMYGNGCYAEAGLLAASWKRAGLNGLGWDAFLEKVRGLGLCEPWRYGVAGDLPGVGDELDVERLAALVDVAGRSCGWAYTHKPLRTARERAALREANRGGFTVNLSADSPPDADRLHALRIGPVAALIPPGTRTGDRTPGGLRIVVCPAQTEAGLTCAQCRLCSVADRIGVVGFFPHGGMSKQVTRRLTVLPRERSVA
jgi:hypothetical protein